MYILNLSFKSIVLKFPYELIYIKCGTILSIMCFSSLKVALLLGIILALT